MKIYLSVLTQLLFSFSVYCQNIDYSNFDYKTFETKVVEKINTYRSSIGLETLYTSNTLKNFTSVKTSTQNSTQDKGFHLKADDTNDTINRKLYSELYNMTGGKCGVKEPSSVFINEGYGEIISIVHGKYNTYDELAIEVLNAWLHSPGHKKTIETKFVNLDGFAGLISCSAKISKSGKIYTVVNFVSVSNF
jgi:uncharacterized protein YkwD